MATIYLGTQGWSYKDWVGTFYPQGTGTREFLAWYAKSFNAVELDTTFYGTPAPGRVRTWAEETPDSFQFTAKVPRSVTHDRHLVDCGPDFHDFLIAMDALGSKLGAILIQMPPDFTSDERPALEAFLGALPSGFRFAIEFRHRSWLDDRTDELLRARGVAWTMLDLFYMPRRTVVTADFTYVRWLGDRKRIVRMHETQIDKRAELDAWAETLDRIAQSVERVYGFANNHYSGHSPADIRYLRRKLGMPSPAPDVDPLQQGTLL